MVAVVVMVTMMMMVDNKGTKGQWRVWGFTANAAGNTVHLGAPFVDC